MHSIGESSADEAFQLWRRQATDAARNVFGEDSTQHKHLSALKFFAMRYGWTADTPPLTSKDHSEAFEGALRSATVQLTAMIAEVESFWPEDVATLATQAPLAKVLNICDRFPDAVRQLSTRRANRPVLSM